MGKNAYLANGSVMELQTVLMDLMKKNVVIVYYTV